MRTIFFARVLAWAAAILVAAIAALPAAAAPPSALATCILAARPGMTAADLFDRPALFDCVPGRGTRPQGDYWVMSAPLPAIEPMTSVRTASVWQRRVTLYIRYADGAIRARGFTSRTAAPHLAMGATFDIALPDRPAPPVRLLWHVEGSGAVHGVVTGARLIGDAERHREDLAVSTLYAALGGMVAALLVYNLALWGALRQRFQPAYCAMLVFVFLYGVSSSGAIELLTGMDNNRRLQLNMLFLAATGASAVTFARLFFGGEVFRGWLRRAADAVITAMLAGAVGYAVVAPWQFALLDRLVTLSFLSLVALVPAVLARAWRVGSPDRWLFALAWGAPIVLAGVRVAAALDLVGWHFWIDHSTVPAMALEACLSALAIAARVRTIGRERDDAREGELAARVLADTDPLTGLLNRRSFLDQAIGRGDDQVLILIDIDHFKQINETIGHDGGDEVLRVVARTLRQELPATGLVARIGGEEFAILTPAATPPLPADILYRIRAAAMPYDLTVTASTGACMGPLVSEAHWKELYRRADRALFDAKAAGRDRSRAAEPLARAA